MIAVFAPMGAGKGVGVVIPNLLDYRGSIVYTDIKGENSAITQRKRETLGKVRILDTTDPLRSDHFNPLDMIRAGSFHERDDAEALARLMIIPDEKTSHWDAKTEGLLACLILHVMRHEPERRNLAQVRSLSTLPPESLKDLLQTISTGGSRPAAEIAASFLSMDGSEEFKSIPSNAACKVFFNVADLEAARFVSEIIGQTTSLSRNAGTSHTKLDPVRQHRSLGQSETGRWLLDPSEVMRLPGRHAIVIYRSDILRHPVLAAKVNYRSWRNLHWRGKYDKWPPRQVPAEPPATANS